VIETGARSRISGRIATLTGSPTRLAVTIFVGALAVRAVVALAVTVLVGGGLVPDESTFWRLGRGVADGTSGWTKYERGVHSATPGFLWLVWAIGELPLGESLLAPRLVIAIFGAVTAAAAAVLAWMVAGRRAAIAAGLLVSLWPSQVLFSSLLLRDAIAWAALTVLAVLVAVGMRARGRRHIVLGGVGVLLLVSALVTVRWGTGLVAGSLLLPAALAYPRRLRPVAVGAAAVVLASVSLTVALPRFGLTGDGADEAVPVAPSEQEVARSATVTDGRAGSPTETDPVVEEPGDVLDPDGRGAVFDHTADRRAATAAGACTALDDADAGTLRQLGTGTVAVLLGPAPWHPVCSTLGRVAQVETAFWYLLLVLAGLGVGRVTDRRAMVLPVLVAVALTVGYALGDGNVGTAYRHRGEFTWVVLILAGAALAGFWRARSTREGAGERPARPQPERASVPSAGSTRGEAEPQP
jgi:hypothetical protein